MSEKRSKVAVVGAGLSGLSCAAALVRGGSEVQVFEKARGPGGRMSTRRRDEQTFDHGAQFFRVRSAGFAEQVEDWEKAGWVSEWSGRFGVLSDNQLVEDADSRTRWVGSPRMNAIARGLSNEADVHWQARVVGLHRHSEGWVLRLEEGGLSEAFDAVVLSCPGPQAAALCPTDSPIHARARRLHYSPCWALMAEFEERLSVNFDGIRSDGDLSWMARDSSKPGRPEGERWVLHASAEFSNAHLEASREEVGEQLMAQFTARFGGNLRNLQVHRWRYALSGEPSGAAFEWDSSRRLGLTGDALVGPRVEAAWQSGRGMADALLGNSG